MPTTTYRSRNGLSGLMAGHRPTRCAKDQAGIGVGSSAVWKSCLIKSLCSSRKRVLRASTHTDTPVHTTRPLFPFEISQGSETIAGAGAIAAGPSSSLPLSTPNGRSRRIQQPNAAFIHKESACCDFLRHGNGMIGTTCHIRALSGGTDTGLCLRFSRCLRA